MIGEGINSVSDQTIEVPTSRSASLETHVTMSQDLVKALEEKLNVMLYRNLSQVLLDPSDKALLDLYANYVQFERLCDSLVFELVPVSSQFC